MDAWLVRSLIPMYIGTARIGYFRRRIQGDHQHIIEGGDADGARADEGQLRAGVEALAVAQRQACPGKAAFHGPHHVVMRQEPKIPEHFQPQCPMLWQNRNNANSFAVCAAGPSVDQREVLTPCAAVNSQRPARASCCRDRRRKRTHTGAPHSGPFSTQSRGRPPSRKFVSRRTNRPDANCHYFIELLPMVLQFYKKVLPQGENNANINRGPDHNPHCVRCHDSQRCAITGLGGQAGFARRRNQNERSADHFGGGH